MSYDRRLFDPSHDLEEERDPERNDDAPAPAPGKMTRTLRLAVRAAEAAPRVGSGGPAAPHGGAAIRSAVATGTPALLPTVQRRAADDDVFAGVLPASAGEPPLEVAAAGVRGSAATLPHRDAIQAAFGHHDVSAIGAYTGGEASAAARALGAMAYANGERVAFASSTPDLFTAAHEAAHVVQQRAGVSLPGGVGRADDRYERHADAVAEAVVAGRSAAPVLDGFVGPTGVATAAAVSGGAVQRRPAGATRNPPDPVASLVDNLLAAIDRAASNGLESLEARDDVEGARRAAQQVSRRIANLLSVTAAPGGGAPAEGQQHDAARALGRAAALGEALRAKDAPSAAEVDAALEQVTIELAPTTGWQWTPTAAGAKAGGGLTRAEGLAIGRGTLSIVRRRARAVAGTHAPGAIVATATAIAEDLEHARRELIAAAKTPDHDALRDEVLALGRDLAPLETTAYQLGLGHAPALEALRAAETGLRHGVGLASERVVWDTALPTLQAIIDIVSQRWEIDRAAGVVHDRSQPTSHDAEVPAGYRPLLEEWFQLAHGRVARPDGSVTVTRGRALTERLDGALARTMPLINALHAEGNPDQLVPWLEPFYARVDAVRARATSETVRDHVDGKAEQVLAQGGTPLDQLDLDTQVRVAATRLVAVARQTASVAQRIHGAQKELGREALEAFKTQLHDVDLPADVKAKLMSATSVADVSQHIAALANGVEAIVNIVDPAERERVYVKEFGRNPAAAAADVGKNLLWLVQGGIAAYNSVVAGVMIAKGQGDAALALLGSSASTLSKISVALNVLNVAHGTFLVIWGNGEVKVDGAVEATWGALGLAGRGLAKTRFARFVRFTGPLAASIAITHFTIKQIGHQAVGALYGMIQLGLDICFRDMQRNAREIHASAMRLAVALESSDELQGAELALELAKQTDAIRWNLRDFSLKPYIERTRQGKRNEDPGTYRPLRVRFEPLWSAPMTTDPELFATADLFLSIVVSCFDDAQRILDDAVAASLADHG